MAHFFGSMMGNRGEVTRCGSKLSGLTAHIRSWDVGVRVEIFVNSKGEDTIRLYQTEGSNGSPLSYKFIKEVRAKK